MRKFLILFFTASALISCDWHSDPQILRYSEIKQSEDGKYICQVNSFYCYIDSVLTKENGVKCYEEPILGEDVTAFTLGKNDEIYFYKGHVSSEEIKKVYFQDDDSNLPKDGVLVILGLFLLFGYLFYKIACS